MNVGYIMAALVVSFLAGMGVETVISDRHYIPQIEQLKAQTESASHAAKLIVQNQEEIYHASKIKLDDSTALIKLYRERMLHAPGKVSASPATNCPGGADIPSATSSAGSDELAFETGCFQLAVWHEACREMVVGNRFPVK